MLSASKALRSAAFRSAVSLRSAGRFSGASPAAWTGFRPSVRGSSSPWLVSRAAFSSGETVVDAEFETVHEWGKGDEATQSTVEIERTLDGPEDVRHLIGVVQSELQIHPDIQFTQSNLDVKSKFLTRLFQESDVWVDSRHLHKIKDLDSCESVVWEVYQEQQEE